jgi:serine/threonine-protein kinase
MRVRVATRPALHDCWSVNISLSGIGLSGYQENAGTLARGASLEMVLRLPNDAMLNARGRIVWMAPTPSGPRPRWAIGVAFEPLVPEAEKGLREYLQSNRLRVGVAYATREEVALLRHAFEGQGNLIFTDSADGAQALATRGNIGALVICGDEARASALVDWIANWQVGHDALALGGAPAPAPRLLVHAAVDRRKLLGWLNEGRIFRWLSPPLVPKTVREEVERACAEYAVYAEREHLALALAGARRAPRPVDTVQRGPGPAQPVSGVAATLEGWTESGPVAGEPRPEGLTPAQPVTIPLGAAFSLPAVRDITRYEDPRSVGVGGMGVVFACTDNRLSRRVALKTLQKRYAGRTDLAAVLAREARITGNLEHPNIIPVYDAGLNDDGLPFFVMKLVETPTLADVLDTPPGRDDLEQPLGRLLRIFVQVCQAVDYAHSRGVVHCDLKPSNILLGSFGQVLVVDWGLAYVAEEGTIFRGGTPGYVSPEQMEQGGKIDERADVYALGSILYHVLCGRQPFDDSAYQSPQGIRHPRTLPPPPIQVFAHRSTPEELEEVCLRAMAVKREDRYASAGALADAIEAFLEGTKERERRRERADELVRSADELAANYFDLVNARPERVRDVEALRASVAPWEPPERKRALWDAEDGLAVTDTLTVRTLQSAASAYEQALDEVRDHTEAHQGLVRLYSSELERAERRRDERDRVYFEGLVRQYDDGGAARVGAGSGLLSVECAGGEAAVSLARLEEKDRRIEPVGVKALGATPVQEVQLGLGAYLVTLGVTGAPPVRFPVVAKGGGHVRVFADPHALEGQPTDEVLVPGGPALLGGDEGAPGGGQMREVEVGSFFMSQRPVSFREYLAFLAEVMNELGQTAQALIPRHGQGDPFWQWNGQSFVLAEMRQWGDNPEELLEVPAFGVDLRGMEGYAKWKSRKTGRRYRLPTEDEWEKAARGTDGRLYPWGNLFDASFCCMRDSSPGAPRPRPSGTFAADVSPFGVRDMAGGVADWVTPTSGPVRKGVREIVSRGGAWCDWWTDCLLTAHRSYLVGERSARVGFRLVRDGPASVGYTLAA